MPRNQSNSNSDDSNWKLKHDTFGTILSSHSRPQSQSEISGEQTVQENKQKTQDSGDRLKSVSARQKPAEEQKDTDLDLAESMAQSDLEQPKQSAIT